MNKTLPEIREEIEKGCGEYLTPNITDGVCGNPIDFNCNLCPTCQAKLQTLNECEDAFKDNHNWIDEKDCFNEGFNKGYQKCEDTFKEIIKDMIDMKLTTDEAEMWKNITLKELLSQFNSQGKKKEYPNEMLNYRSILSSPDTSQLNSKEKRE